MTEHARIERSFARSRPTYDEAARPQRLIAALLARRLRQLGGADFPSVFEFGCGTGHLTRALARRNRFREIWLNDLSYRDIPPCDRFLPGPIEKLDPGRGFDLIASASTLQWLDRPQDALARIAHWLLPQGWLAVSSFGPAHFREIGTRGVSLLSSEHLGRALPGDLHVMDHGSAIFRQRFPSPRAVLRHLRLTGVNGRAEKGWTRRDLDAFCDRYLARYGDAQGRVSLTWNPVWLIARKRLSPSGTDGVQEPLSRPWHCDAGSPTSAPRDPYRPAFASAGDNGAAYAAPREG